MSMKLFTFCVFIGKHSKNGLLKMLDVLISSLDKNVIDYELIVYTNFYIKLDNEKIKIREYYDESEMINRKLSSSNYCEICKESGDMICCDEKQCDFSIHPKCARLSHIEQIETLLCKKCFSPNGFCKYKDPWLNLSFNKINLYNDLYNETGIDYTWIDLDTYVATDISYINDYPAFFIETGGHGIKPWYFFHYNKEYWTQEKNYIQGNVWKLNRTHYTNIMNLYKKLLDNKLFPMYDLQDIFNYYVLHENADIIILGKTLKKETLNGLAMWSKDRQTHPTSETLALMYYDENNILRTSYHPDKEIHFVSFVMLHILQLLEDENFKRLFG